MWHWKNLGICWALLCIAYVWAGLKCPPGIRVRHGEDISATEEQTPAKVRSLHRRPSCTCTVFQDQPLALQNGFSLPPRYSTCAQMQDKLLLRIRVVGVTLQVDFAATAADAFLSLKHECNKPGKKWASTAEYQVAGCSSSAAFQKPDCYPKLCLSHLDLSHLNPCRSPKAHLVPFLVWALKQPRLEEGEARSISGFFYWITLTHPPISLSPAPPPSSSLSLSGQR